MATSPTNSLLSLLLALNALEVPLAEQESADLKEIGKQLRYVPGAWDIWDIWDIIEPDLMAVVEGNPALQQLYQESLTRLEQCNGQFLPNLLPSLAELEAELPSLSNEPEPYSAFMERATKDNPELKSYRNSLETVNVAFRVFAHPQPEQAAKKVSKLQRAWQFLQKPIF